MGRFSPQAMEKPSRDKKSMDKVVGGSLKMKGMVVKSKKKKKRKHRDDGAESAPEADEEPQHGKGTILSNATSIMGKDTDSWISFNLEMRCSYSTQTRYHMRQGQSKLSSVTS